jgi:hypothetical protein
MSVVDPPNSSGARSDDIDLNEGGAFVIRNRYNEPSQYVDMGGKWQMGWLKKW